MNITNLKHHAFKALVLFCIGGLIYATIEILYRGYTHWTMAVLGGLMFLLLGGLNNWLPWALPIWMQCILGTLIVTAGELVAGIILNIWLGLGIWDYSHLPGNVLGQICPQFALAWFGLSLVGIVLDDYLRYWLFREEKPHYHLL